MQVTGEVHSQGSWCGVQYGSGLLPLFSSSRSLVLSHEPVLPPSRCCGWWCGHVQLSRSSHPPSLLLACVHLFWSSMFLWSLQCIPYCSSCREPGRPLPSSSLQASSASLSQGTRPPQQGMWTISICVPGPTEQPLTPHPTHSYTTNETAFLPFKLECR